VNRREAIKKGLQAVATTSMLSGVKGMSQDCGTSSAPSAGDTLYVNPSIGADTNSGAKSSPLRTLSEAARRVNSSFGPGPVTVILSEGIYAIDEPVFLNPERRMFTKTERLTIRAEVLPDDPEWHAGRMPTLIHTMGLITWFQGHPDTWGGVALGLMIETSFVTIRGLKILGIPVVENPKPGLIWRVYPIVRFDQTLEDLEIAQCVFTGDRVNLPNHLPIMINGNGLVVHHCVFYGLKISAVFWVGEGIGHAMRNCVCHSLYGSAIWTAGSANDLDYRNNVVSKCNYVWTYQSLPSARADLAGRGGREQGPSPNPPPGTHYKVIDSYFAGNRKLTGTGTGPKLEYEDCDSSFLEMIRTKITDQPIELEFDQTKRNYLHPIAGSEAYKVGAGLFLKPLA
jgi:hypothetical protein